MGELSAKAHESDIEGAARRLQQAFHDDVFAVPGPEKPVARVATLSGATAGKIYEAASSATSPMRRSLRKIAAVVVLGRTGFLQELAALANCDLIPRVNVPAAAQTVRAAKHAAHDSLEAVACAMDAISDRDVSDAELRACEPKIDEAVLRQHQLKAALRAANAHARGNPMPQGGSHARRTEVAGAGRKTSAARGGSRKSGKSPREHNPSKRRTR